MRVWFVACLLINGTDWVWQIDRSSLTVTAILPRRGFPRPGRFVRREINPREVQDRRRNPRGSGHARRGRPARVRLQWRRRGHLSSHHHTWTNVCIRATARRPRTTAMGAELSAPRGAERPLLRSHNGPAYDQIGSVNSGHPVGPASVAARVEVVDRCLRHDVIEAYEELCENRLLPVSVLPR